MSVSGGVLVAEPGAVSAWAIAIAGGDDAISDDMVIRQADLYCMYRGWQFRAEWKAGMWRVWIDSGDGIVTETDENLISAARVTVTQAIEQWEAE